MYKQIKKEPVKAIIEIVNDELIYHCSNKNYFFVNFKKLVENLYDYYPKEEAQIKFFSILRRFGFSRVNFKYVNTPQWYLCSYTVNEVENAFVIYCDSYSTKIRINIIYLKTDTHCIEQDTEQKSILYFIGVKGIEHHINDLIEKRNKLDSEIKELKKLI